MKKFILIIAAMAMLASCSSRGELTKTKIQSLKEMAELGTVEYTVKKIIKANDDVWYKYGDRKILYSSTSYLKAGIDLAEFSDKDVQYDQKSKTITATFPKAKLLSFNMPVEKIDSIYERTTGLRAKISLEEKNALKVQAEKQILDDVPNMGILQEAENNARDFFNAMFARLGYETITVNFK